MATLIDDNFMVCADCYVVIGTGDGSSLDYPAGRGNETRLSIVDSAITVAQNVSGGSIHAGDSDREREFSKSPCDCCGTYLAGSRHHCVILSP